MKTRRTYHFELELVDHIEDLIIHNDRTITIMFRKSNYSSDSNDFEINMSFDQFDILMEKFRRTEQAINEAYAEESNRKKEG